MPARLLAVSFAALVAATAALAQDTTETPPADTAEAPPAEAPPAEAPPAGPEDLNMGTPVEGEVQVGEPYFREVFGDWAIRCLKMEEGQPDPCELYQLLRDAQDNPVAEITMFPLPPGGQAAAGATVVAPLETLLTEALTLSVDGGAARRYPFSFCTQAGCVARIGFTEEEVNQFKRGNSATLRIVPAAAPDQEVILTISLSGFTAGYEAGTPPLPAE